MKQSLTLLITLLLALPAGIRAASPYGIPAVRGKTMKPQFWFEDNNQCEAGG